MRKQIDPEIDQAVEEALPKFRELRLLEEEMREGITNYIEHHKEINRFVERLHSLGVPDHEVQKMKEGNYDD